MVPNLKFLMRYMWLNHHKYSSAFTPLDNECVNVDYVGDFEDEASLTLKYAELEVDGRKISGDILFFDKLSEWNNLLSKWGTTLSGVCGAIINIKDVQYVASSHTVMRCSIEPKLLDEVLSRINSERNICVDIISSKSSLFRRTTFESLLFERLEAKAKDVLDIYADCGNWDKVYIKMLFNTLRPKDATAKRVLSSMINGTSLELVMRNLKSQEEIEAYLFGVAGLLHGDTNNNSYLNTLLNHFKRICEDNNIRRLPRYDWKGANMSKIYISIAQLAALLHRGTRYTTLLANEYSRDNLYSLLECDVLPYWQEHSSFNSKKSSNSRKAELSKWRLDIFIINAIIPMNIAYYKHLGVVNDDIKDKIIELLRSLKGESYSIIRSWQKGGLEVPTAYESQALLQLDKRYCNEGRCLDCILFSTNIQ